MFRTPRLLLEAKIASNWQPIRIYCNYPHVRLLLNALPRLSVSFGGMDFVRVRRLKTHEEIAEAKLACYKYNDGKRPDGRAGN
jgi:hypothetical protein